MFEPAEQFKSCVLSLLADQDYEKIIDEVAKVDKVFASNTPASVRLDSEMCRSSLSASRLFSHFPKHSGLPPLFWLSTPLSCLFSKIQQGTPLEIFRYPGIWQGI